MALMHCGWVWVSVQVKRALTRRIALEGEDNMREHRAAATTAGILYITGTVAGVLSMVVSAPVRDARDPLAYAVGHSGAVATGALLVLVMGLSLAFVPVVLFRVLRPIDEVLAVGYLIVRGAVETACYVVLAIGWLLLVPLGEAMAAGAGTASPAGIRVGNLVIDADATDAVLTLVFCLGASMFYVLLYRSRIVPRWISTWGLVAIPFYVAADLLAMYGVFDANAREQVLMFMPLAVQEMVLAVWMIARGFRPAAVSTTSELAASGRTPTRAVPPRPHAPGNAGSTALSGSRHGRATPVARGR